MKLIFSLHAEEKLKLLEARGFPVSKNQIVECLENPDRIVEGYGGRKIAQKKISEEHVLRVVFVKMVEAQKVITVYPGRRDRYED